MKLEVKAPGELNIFWVGLLVLVNKELSPISKVNRDKVKIIVRISKKDP